MSLRVYISVDIEGMEGVVSYNETLRGKGDYELSRRRLTKDVNAAIAAAKAEGATEILVCEGHADMENLLFDELDPAADLVSGAMRSSLQMQEIETGFDAMVLFGHAGGGQTVGGVLDHTFNSKKIHGLRLNGLTMNTEAVFNAAVAGHYGVPMVAVIGDRAVVIQEILIYCSYQSKSPLSVQSTLTPVDRILQFIAENVEKPLDAAIIADHMALSKSYVQNSFCQVMHTGLKQYIMEKKILCAHNDLLQGMRPGQVAEKYSFSEYSVFFRQYKKIFGCSPRAAVK